MGKTISKKEKNLKKVSKEEERVRLHKSFKRSYWEDYQRELEVPGVMSHLFLSFKMIFKNWKLFLPFLAILVVINVVCVGIMNEETYTSFQDIINNVDNTGLQIGVVTKAGILLASTVVTGGLSSGVNESTVVFGILIFLIIWLVTIYLLRFLMAEKKIRLKDGLYNAMTPLISTFLVLVVALLQCIPVIILVVAYSAALKTDFLSTPFYALVFFIFAALMIILTTYWLSSTLIALVAVSAPGLEPVKALKAASDLMAGRRIKFIIRLIGFIITTIVIWLIIMIPLILFDFWMKGFEWTTGIPFVPVCVNIMICFTGVFMTTYLYIYYRWLLDYKEK